MTSWWPRRARNPRALTGPGSRNIRPELESLEQRLVPAISVTDLGSQSPNVLVQNLLGPTAAVSNIQYQGTGSSAGTFTSGSNVVGLDSGIILSTGHADAVVGPFTGNRPSFDNNLPGDSDLSALIAPAQTRDATILQFDVTPTGNTITFRYVFGSGEYPQLPSSHDDIMGIYVNGVNQALVPGTNTPVSVDTINQNTNTQYFINNTSGALDTSLSGLTRVLTAQVAVAPGVANHIKIAIGDYNTRQVDSDVFIQVQNSSSSLSSSQNQLLSQGLRVFSPFRYSFDRPTGEYIGNFTVIDTQGAIQNQSVTLEFTDLPTGVKVENATGTDPNNHNAPYIRVNVGSLPIDQALRIQVKLLNPDKASLGTFNFGLPVKIMLGPTM